jgi:hypothetical protein
VTEPSYVSLSALKDYLKITDSTRDTMLTLATLAASRSIDLECGRRFYLDGSATVRTINPNGSITYQDDDGVHLLVPDIGSSTGLKVETGVLVYLGSPTWTDITSTGIEMEPIDFIPTVDPMTSILRLGGRPWGGTGARVRVTAQWGWPAVPDMISESALILAARLFKRKDSPEGIMADAQWGAIRLSRTDPDVAAMVGNYKLSALG